MKERRGKASITHVSNFSSFLCLLPFSINEKLYEINSENNFFKGILIICTHKPVVKPLIRGLESFYFLCKAILILKYLQDKAPIFEFYYLLCLAFFLTFIQLYALFFITIRNTGYRWEQNSKIILLNKVNIYNLWLRTNYLIRICITFSLKWKNWQAHSGKRL